MNEAWLIDAVRSPYGRRGGTLSESHPIDLLALVMAALMDRAGVSAGLVDDVIMGCGAQVGAQAGNIARRAVLAAGWPEHVPGTTVERQGASSAQAVLWASQAVMAGAQDLVVAGGIDVMSAVPLGANLAVPSVGKPFGQRLSARYALGDGLLPPGRAAEAVARHWSLTRRDLDDWALSSIDKARQAARLATHLVTVPAATGRGAPLWGDEALETPLTAKAMRGLSPLFETDGLITAGNLSAEADGAAAVLVASPSLARRLKLAPKARLVSASVSGGPPSLWPASSVGATESALRTAGMALDELGRYDVHESSAAAALAWLGATGADRDKLNPDGGSLAWGSPVGAVGAGMVATALSALASGRASSALVSVAADGGVAAACVLVRA